MSRNDPGSPRSLHALVGAAALVAVALAYASPAGAEKRLNLDKLEEGYVAALEQLSHGDKDQALETLMATEIEALGDVPSTSRIDRVWRAKLAVVRKALELTSPEVLVPVILLHHDVYDRYREANKPVLARHARDMASDLAAFKVQTTKADKDREFAGWVLTSFGVALLDIRTSGASASILRDALDVSPANPAALQGLAWAHEIHGEYREAAELLDRLLKSQPGNDAARLRLATCQRRLGEDLRGAQKNLELLLRDATEPWVRSLAYQELARTLMSRVNLEAAGEVARRGLEELPAEQEIAILYASISERLGRVNQADEVISRIVPADPGARSARLIYDSRPELAIEEARAAMRSMRDERLGVLAEGLRWWGSGAVAEAPPEGEEQG